MKTTLRPFRPIKPGEILEEELDARGWSPADFGGQGEPSPRPEVVAELLRVLREKQRERH